MKRLTSYVAAGTAYEHVVASSLRSLGLAGLLRVGGPSDGGLDLIGDVDSLSTLVV